MYKVLPKGDRVLRIEAIVHNAKKEFARGYGLDRFSEIVEALRSLVERFLEVLRSVEACWVSDETWESLSEPSQVGAARMAGLDLNRTLLKLAQVVGVKNEHHRSPRQIPAAEIRVRGEVPRQNRDRWRTCQRCHASLVTGCGQTRLA